MNGRPAYIIAVTSEWRVVLLRAWYYLRELLGRPHRMTEDEFATATATVLLAGSPWVWTTSTSSTGYIVKFAVTHTTWPLGEDKS